MPESGCDEEPGLEIHISEGVEDTYLHKYIDPTW